MSLSMPKLPVEKGHCKNCEQPIELVNVKPFGNVWVHSIKRDWQKPVNCVCPTPVFSKRELV